MRTKLKRRGRPRMASGQTRSESIFLRLQPKEKKGFSDAAMIAGIPVAIWIRERLRQAATRELEAAARPIPFLNYDDENEE